MLAGKEDGDDSDEAEDGTNDVSSREPALVDSDTDVAGLVAVEAKDEVEFSINFITRQTEEERRTSPRQQSLPQRTPRTRYARI
jgi:hypothetical protein